MLSVIGISELCFKNAKINSFRSVPDFSILLWLTPDDLLVKARPLERKELVSKEGIL